MSNVTYPSVVTPPQILNVRLSSPTATISGTNSTGLSIALAKNTNYTFKAFIVASASTAVLTNYQIHALASGAALVSACGATNDDALTGDAFRASAQISAVTTNIFSFLIYSGVYILLIYGVITVGATATTLQIDQVATGTTDATAAGSWLEAIAIA